MNRRDAMKAIAGAACTTALASKANSQENQTLTSASETEKSAASPVSHINKGGIEFWLTTSLQRVYPTSTAQDSGAVPGPLHLKSGRNYRLSFQACYRNLETSSAQMECQALAPDGIEVTVRRVGFVPMQQLDTYVPLSELEGIGKIPGLCPDPLYPDSIAHVGPLGTAVFWITVYVPESITPGLKTGSIQFKLANRFGYMGWNEIEKFTVDLPFKIQVSDLVVKRRKDFPVTLWLSADSIWEYYKIEPFSDRFWQLADAYIKNLTDHGVDVIYTPIFNIRAEKLKRPAQLLKVRKTGENAYEFDFTDLRKWITLAKKHNANFIEFSHFFSPAPESAAYPQKIYERDEAMGELLWPANTPATSDTYRRFLEQFLPAFKAVLEEEGMLEKSLFHLADEPDGPDAIKRYRAARDLLKEMAPWIKVMDAMSEPHFAIERLSDMPIPSIVTANKFTAAGCPAWVYYCCGPRDGYIQRLLDTPLWKIRMSGWLFYRLKAMGFLHWGYNYWFKFCTDQIADPFQDATNGAWPGMPYGDTFAVYPGADGPMDSIRWEIFAESLQDYALLQSAGIAKDNPMLSELKDYNDFPKTAEWVQNALSQIFDKKS